MFKKISFIFLLAVIIFPRFVFAQEQRIPFILQKTEISSSKVIFKVLPDRDASNKTSLVYLKFSLLDSSEKELITSKVFQLKNLKSNTDKVFSLPVSLKKKPDTTFLLVKYISNVDIKNESCKKKDVFNCNSVRRHVFVVPLQGTTEDFSNPTNTPSPEQLKIAQSKTATEMKKSELSGPITKELKEGMKDSQVKILEDFFVQNFDMPGKADETFNPETTLMIKNFQEIFNLKITGIVNKETWTKINFLINGLTKEKNN